MAANSAGVCYSFKQEILKKVHNIESDTINGALYQANQTITPALTAYTATGEVAQAGGYTTGGKAITPGTVGLTGAVAFWQPGGALSWTNVNFTTDCLLLYNVSAANKAISVHTFTPVTPAGSFSLSMPNNNSSEALLRFN